MTFQINMSETDYNTVFDVWEFAFNGNNTDIGNQVVVIWGLSLLQLNYVSTTTAYCVHNTSQVC